MMVEASHADVAHFAMLGPSRTLLCAELAHVGYVNHIVIVVKLEPTRQIVASHNACVGRRAQVEQIERRSHRNRRQHAMHNAQHRKVIINEERIAADNLQ